MAGGIDWFRWHHGSVTDPKFQLVAKKAGVRLGDVIAVWAFVLEKASADADRGAIGPIDFETLDFLLGTDEGTAARILDAMTQRGLIEGSRVAAWDKRQPKREREADSSTGRTRAYRERQKAAGDADLDDVTPSDATERQETPRGEESRGDIEENPTGSSSPAEPTTCPHRAILALFGKHLPNLPQPKPELWDGQRQKNLAARWRWLLTARKTSGERYATSEAEGLDWFERFFGYVAKSDFLTGRSGDWQCDLGWLVKAENFTKVIQGNYENKEVTA